jgi:hypothetical protein
MMLRYPRHFARIEERPVSDESIGSVPQSASKPGKNDWCVL